jgi:hypothetical protein
MCKVYNGTRTGELAVIEALFERCWLDIVNPDFVRDQIKKGKMSKGALIVAEERARDAEDFLWDPDTIRALAALGIEPQYYVKMLLSTEDVAARDFERRVLALDDWGYSRSGICYVIWGTISKSYLRKVGRVLEAARL